MSTKKIPIYQAKVGDADDTGIYAISFVGVPANESNFVALKKAVKLNLNRTKQILTGVVLIPGQQIYRNDAQLGEYYLTFTAQDIEKIAQKMMKYGAALSTTTHQHEKGLEGNHLVEVWTVTNSKIDKSVALGLGEFPVGTLLASYKVNDAAYWRSEVLTGNVKGFSLEGFFNFNTIKMSKPKVAAKPAVKKGNALAAMFRAVAATLEGETVAEAEAVAEVAALDETDSGTPTIIFELADGGEIWVDAGGFATLDGEQMAPGEHALKDGSVIVIDEAGQLVITQEEGDGTEPEAAEAALAAARTKGTAFLAAIKKKPVVKTANTAKIAALEKQIAELKKTPSAPKATARVEAGAQDKPLTNSQKIAAVLKAKADRKNA